MSQDVGRGNPTPQIPVSVSSAYPPISPLLRYPMCAVPGGQVIYSPMVAGQTLLPWRPFPALTTPTTPLSVAPNVSLVPPSTQVTPTQTTPLTPLMQLSALPYMGMTATTLLSQPQSMGVVDRRSTGSPGKRDNRSANASPDTASKRHRLTAELPITRPSSQRSPVIKFIPYTVPSSTAIGTPPIISQTSTSPQQDTPVTTPPVTMTTENAISSSLPTLIIPVHRPLPLSGIALLRCLGSISDSVVNEFSLQVCTFLQELYLPSRTSSSSPSIPSSSSINSSPLTPESCALLTISYLGSLLPGQAINTEVIRAIFQFAQSCECDWLQYYRKHKKMSESTFVQSQLMHLSRIAVYPNMKRLRVVISQQTLSECVQSVLHGLFQTPVSPKDPPLPEFVVIVSMLPSISLELSVLAFDPVQVRDLVELQKTLTGHDNEVARVKLSIPRHLLSMIKSFHRRLDGAVSLPYWVPQPAPRDLIPRNQAMQMCPPVSHVVEHKAKGPFPDQYNMAMFMLQRVLNSGQIEDYKRIDFRILCPNEKPLLQQVMAEVKESGLLQHLGLVDTEEILPAILNQRVVPCIPDKISTLAEEVSTHPHTLFLLIAKSAHLTTRVLSHARSHKIPDNQSCDCNAILSTHQNAVIILVSSHPYPILTNRSLVPSANEIHWSLQSGKNSGSVSHTGMEFSSPVSLLPGVNGDGGLIVREDTHFEEKVHQACNERPILSLLAVRAQLLLSDYAAALLAASKLGSHVPSLPNTQEIANMLVQGPLSNSRGKGCMVLLRCHDNNIAKEIYQKLIKVRNALGLEYRFEIILDSGEGPLQLSGHFMKRIRQWQTRSDSYAGSQCSDSTTYQDLDSLPCLLVLAGRVRAAGRMPCTLQYLDLRLCHSPSLTRVMFEADLSLLNGYQKPVSSPSLLPYSLGFRARDEDSDVFSSCTQNDSSVVMDNGQARSSLGSCESGEGQLLHPVASLSADRRTVVEWKATAESRHHHGHQVMVKSEIQSPSSRTSPSKLHQIDYHVGEMEHSGMNGIHEHRGVAIVEIPQPEDQLSSDIHTTFDTSNNSTQSVGTQQVCDEEEEEDLFADLSGSDTEDSETDEPNISSWKHVCFLSRQYFHLWKSPGMSNSSVLLPPSDGVMWQNNHKRPPLVDLSHQSGYYRMWSKPLIKGVRLSIDNAMKEFAAGNKRRFLLTGPAKVGKMGACLLLVRLLHDYLRSSQGLTAISCPPSVLPILSSRECQLSSHSPHSRIVPLDLLSQLQSDSAPSSPPTISIVAVGQATSEEVLVSSSLYMAHNSSHSCPECSSQQTTLDAINAHRFSSSLSLGTSTVTVQWSIPSAKHSKVITGHDKTILDVLRLPTWNKPHFPSHSLSPIFSIALGQPASALLNLRHTAPNQLHVVITTLTKLESYYQTWPEHIIAALPNHAFVGMGAVYNSVKRLAEWLYQQNIHLANSMGNGRGQVEGSIWPVVVFMTESVCMVQEFEDSKERCVSLVEVLHNLEREHFLNVAAIAVPHWQESERPSLSTTALPLSLDHNLLMLNLEKTSSIHYNALSFTSADIDFHLRLIADGHAPVVSHCYVYLERLLDHSECPTFPPNLPSPSQLSHTGTLVVSLHHDSSSLLQQPGSLLLETFLLHKGAGLFPSALCSTHPVLMVDNYVNLGASVHASVVSASQLSPDMENLVFGGLVLYLCEGRVISQQLRQLKFMPGACLLLVTRDCRGLVKEVSRLDLEENWQFKLRDEFQTMCTDSHKPLFFLTGKFSS